MQYRRSIVRLLESRLREAPRRIQIVAGPRQVGKSTLVGQVLLDRPLTSFHYAAADDAQTAPSVSPWTDSLSAEALAAPSSGWIEHHWKVAERKLTEWTATTGVGVDLPFVMVLDEIQRVPQWSSTVKGLWDAARAQGSPMHLVLLGSAPLLVQKGLQESLTGRYELIRAPHWSFAEMNEAFDLTLDQYIYFGGYPGAASLLIEETRWRAYVRESLIDPSINRDVLDLSRVDNPALLRRLFETGCEFSGQIVALSRVSQSLQQGHVSTLTDYLRLLGESGLLTGLQKYAATMDRQRKSPPKFQVKNNALMSAQGFDAFDATRADRTQWGRFVESCVGAHLINTADADTQVLYWREGALEVDFVIEHRGRLAAIEVKSSERAQRAPGLDAFHQKHPSCKRWLVGGSDLPLGEFLRQNADYWTR